MVSRYEPGRDVLERFGRRTRLSSHRAVQCAFRLARSATHDAFGRFGKSLGAPRNAFQSDHGRTGKFRTRTVRAGRPSLVAIERRENSRRNRRPGCAHAIVARLQYRNQRRTRPHQRQSLAHRRDGLFGAARQYSPFAFGARRYSGRLWPQG